MALLDELLNALDRWAEWKRMRAAPDRMDALEARVAELEALLGGKTAPGMCRACGERGMRLVNTLQGGTVDMWRCAKCGMVEQRRV